MLILNLFFSTADFDPNQMFRSFFQFNGGGRNNSSFNFEF